MKKFYLFAALAAMLAACSENDLTVEKQINQTAEANEGTVDFDVYVSRGLTRGGNTGVLTYDNSTSPNIPLKKDETIGFGVFGYYTDGEPYSGITKPNFFYNQKVYWYNTRWFYSPVRYWPNEFGGDAISDQVDYVTLFAYAPWTDVNLSTGVATTDPTNNITGMTRNNITGDPFIKYNATMDPSNAVDLCYGVAANQFTSSSSSYSRNTIAKGQPYLNVVKPGTDANSKIKFDFKHALAQLNVTIDANVDDKTNTSTPTEVQTNFTRIWVRSVTFTGITQKGALNLNSTAESAEWYDVNCANKITTGTLTVYDGRKDEKEANDKAPSETPAMLNTKIIQEGGYTLNSSTGVIEVPAVGTKPGVTKTTINLFNSSTSTDPVFVIPTNETMRVTIVYDVETVDKNLPYYLSDGKTQGVTVSNTIYKDINTFGSIKAGQKYILKLHLGMRTVDFDAEVANWEDHTVNVDLPANMPTFAVGSTTPITLGATAGTYQFAIKGFDANVDINAPVLTPVIAANTIVSALTPAGASTADGSGIFVGSATINNNNTVSDKTQDIAVTATAAGSAATTINITQLAHELGMKAVFTQGTNPTIKLTSTASEIADADWDWSKITVKQGSQEKTKDDALAANKFTVEFDASHYPTLKFNETAAPGDVYTITVNLGTGKAPAETVTVVVPEP
jgi:hypothetical protein